MSIIVIRIMGLTQPHRGPGRHRQPEKATQQNFAPLGARAAAATTAAPPAVGIWPRLRKLWPARTQAPAPTRRRNNVYRALSPRTMPTSRRVLEFLLAALVLLAVAFPLGLLDGMAGLLLRWGAIGGGALCCALALYSAFQVHQLLDEYLGDDGSM